MNEQQLAHIGRLARIDGAAYGDCIADHVGRLPSGAACIHLTVYRPGSYGARAEDVIRRWSIPPNDQVVPLFLP